MVSSGILTFVLTTLFVAAPTHAQTTLPHNFTIEGRFYSNGVPINDAVDVKFEVYSDGYPACILYRESHINVNVGSTDTNAQGIFALAMGTGTSTYLGSTTLAHVFASGVTLTGEGGCTVTAAQLAGKHRLVKIYVKLNADPPSSYVALTPDTKITTVPTAMVAETLAGKSPSEFLQPASGTDVTQVNLEAVLATGNATKLVDLAAGTSSLYMKSAPAAAVSFNSQRIPSVADPTAAQDAATKNYVDTNLGGQDIDLQNVAAGSGNGKILIWDSTAAKWVAQTPSTTDSTKLPLAGGTMTGAITMGGNNLLATGHITMSPLKTINLGTFDNAQEATLIAGLTGAQAGAFWYNTDDDTLKVWNGTSAVSQAYLTSGKLDASWIPNTAVTGAAYGSSTQVPTFTVGADGRLSAAANVTISGVAPGGAAGGDLSGTYPNPTIAPAAVGTAEIASNAVTSAKISSTGIAVNRLLITDSSTGANVTYATCSTDEVLKFTATGWACATAASLSAVTSVNSKTGAVVLNAADLGLGTASLKDYGTAAGELVELDAGGKIPSSLLPASSGDIGEVAVGTGLTGGGTSGAVTLNVDVGTTNGKIVQMQTGDKLPAVDGSDLTNVKAVSLHSFAVQNVAPTDGYVLKWNNSASRWEPAAEATGGGGDVTDVNAGTGLTGGGTAGSVTLAVDVGTTNGKIVQMQTGDKLPAVDGSFLTNVKAVSLHSYAVQNVAPSDGYVLKWNNSASQWQPTADTDTGITALTGDVSASGSGSVAVTLTDDSVTNAKIANGAVKTTHLFANPGINRLLMTDGTTGADLTYKECASGEILKYTASGWACASDAGAAGVVTLIDVGTGLTGGPITSYGTIAVDVGITDGKIVQMQTGDKLPAVDGSNLTFINAVKLQSRDVANTAPNTNEVLKWNGSMWLPAAVTSGTVVSVSTGTGLLGGPIIENGTLSVDVGTSNGQIVQMQTGDKLPAVDGSNLINIVASLVSATAGSAAAPSISFSSDTDTGIFRPTANALAITTGGAERLRVDSAGVVSIGTTSPSAGAALEIAGTTSSNSSIIIPRSNTATRPSTGINGMIRYNSTLDKFEAYEGGGWTNMIGSGGGTGDFKADGSVPMTGVFEAIPGNNTGPGITFSGDTNTGIFGPTADTLAITTGGSERLRVDASGNVGIGTTASVSKLTVASPDTQQNTIKVSPTWNNVDTDYSALIVDATNTASGPSSTLLDLKINGSPKFTVNKTGSIWLPNGTAAEPAIVGRIQIDTGIFFPTFGVTAFSNGGTESMRLDASRNLGIGTTSPLARLDVRSTASTDPVYAASFTKAQSSAAGSAYGVSSEVTKTGATSLTFASGYYSLVNNGTGSTLTSANGLYLDANNNGTMTNYYGVYIANPTGTTPTNAYAIYAGTNLKSYFGGNVGIGTTVPEAKLDVRGQMRSTGPAGSTIVNGSAAIDWNNGNAQELNVACTSTGFTNMLDGGSYTLAVTETSNTTCTFSQAGLTFYYSPINAMRTTGIRTVYSFQRIGNSVYVTWSSYQ